MEKLAKIEKENIKCDPMFRFLNFMLQIMDLEEKETHTGN